MKRKLLCLFLCVLLLLSLCACGGGKASAEKEPSATISSTGISFKEAYPAYAALRDAVAAEISGRIEVHNDILRTRQPDSYLLNSDFLLLAFAPFGTFYPDMGKDLSDSSIPDVLASLQANWPDAQLQLTAPGCYEAVFTYVDRTSGSDVNRDGKCIWECDGETGAIRVRFYLDDELQEFTEYVPQGENRYLIATQKDRVVSEYAGGQITALWFEHRIYEPALGTFSGDVRALQPEYFPAGVCPIDQIVSDVDAEYVFILENDTLTYKGQIPQHQLDSLGNQIGINWMSTDAVTLCK